ncbi:macrophage mannose receptor 1-like, partial [Brachionus plicatilis]
SNVPLVSSGCSKPGYFSLDNGKNCYQLYLNEKKWSDAKQFCQQNDAAELATVSDGFEQAFMNLLTYVKTNADPWIGLQKNNDNSFYWSDGWPVTFVNWGENLLDVSSNSNCYYIQSKNGLWNTTSCDDLKPFICKITTEPIPIITPPPPGYCPDNWQEFGSFCYKFDVNFRSYGDAKLDCYQQGAYLVTIHSNEELEFVTSISSTSTISAGPIWIGLEKNQISNSYVWQDGRPLEFLSFANSVQSQPCVYMSDNKWYDSECFYSKKRYTCKLPRIVTTVSTLSTSTTKSVTNPGSSNSSTSSTSHSTSKTQNSTIETSIQSTSTKEFTTLTQSNSSFEADTNKNSELGGGTIFLIIVLVIGGIVVVGVLSMKVTIIKGMSSPIYE